MNTINIEEKKIITEAVNYADVVRAEYEKYKGEKFSELLKVVEDKINQRDEFRKPITIRDVNEALWTDTGVNFIFNVSVYRQTQNRAQKDKTGEDISQLYYTNSQVAKKDPSGFASFSNDDIKREWDKIGSENSVNPPFPTSKSHTLADFYKRLSADSKLRFKGKEINFPFPDGVEEQKKSTLTVETVVQLFKHVMADGKNSIYEKAKAKAEAEVADEKKKSEPAVAARGGRGGRVRRTASTAAPDLRYNIRKPKSSGFIGNYQDNLKKFYTNIPRLSGVADGYKPSKLTDSKYGYRTHYMGVITADEIIKQLRDHIEKSAKKESNEKRIANLSQLLESKLLGFNTELLVEQDQNKLKELLDKLTKIKSALIQQAGTPRSRPTENKFVQGQLLKQYNDILSKLVFKGDKIDFDATLKAMEEKPAVAAKGERATEREKVAQVARTIRGTCWFDFDPNTGGIRSGTPIAVWAAAGADFEEWYKKIVELFNYEGASPQFNYKSGAAAQGRLKGAPSKLNDNKTQSISLDCLSVFMTKIADNFRRNGVEIAIPQFVAAGNDEAKKKAVLTGAKYFLTDKGTYEGSVAHGLEQVLNRVIAIIPSFKRGQIQQAMKILASDETTEDAKQVAAEVVARARRNEKAVTANARKAQTRAAAPAVAARGTQPKPAATAAGAGTGAATLGNQNNPFKNKDAWLKWHKQTPAEQRKKNVVYYVFPDKDNKPLLQKIEYDANGDPTVTAAKQESLKQKREKLLNEAIFKKLVR